MIGAIAARDVMTEASVGAREADRKARRDRKIPAPVKKFSRALGTAAADP